MPVSDYTPTVADVATFIRSRTKTRSGAEAGTFHPATAAEADRTRPTAEQVSESIQTALAPVVSSFGADVPDAPGDAPDLFRIAVKSLVALGAALEIELSYFPEQIPTGRSPYAQLQALYDSRLERLLAGVFPGSSDDPGGGGAVPDRQYPSWGGFPVTGIGMEHPW